MYMLYKRVYSCDSRPFKQDIYYHVICHVGMQQSDIKCQNLMHLQQCCTWYGNSWMSVITVKCRPKTFIVVVAVRLF